MRGKGVSIDHKCDALLLFSVDRLTMWFITGQKLFVNNKTSKERKHKRVMMMTMKKCCKPERNACGKHEKYTPVHANAICQRFFKIIYTECPTISKR